jgi:very-short-patch-repair endonuclease
LLSHSSAGILWGLLGQHDQAGAIEVTHRRDRELPGVMVHRHGLRESSATVRFGIPVTTVERTILDLAERTETVDIGLYMDDALRRDLTTPGRLAAEAATVEHHGRRRLRPYLQALEDRGLGYDPGANDWEQRMDRMWDRLGLPPARRQYRLRIAGRTFKLDRAIVEAKIAVEWNGHSPHGERSRFDYDSDRRALLIGAGWLPLDFTSRSSPELIRKTVLSAYEQRRRDRDIRAVG